MKKTITAMLIALSLTVSANAASTNTHDQDKSVIKGCTTDCDTGILY